MPKKLILTLAAFVLMGLVVLAAGFALEPDSGVSAITDDAACPVAGCASGTCHDLDDVPEPDGVTEMSCPEASCSSVECHAWETLNSGYRRASDASLNLWILFPVVLAAALVLLVRKVG